MANAPSRPACSAALPNLSHSDVAPSEAASARSLACVGMASPRSHLRAACSVIAPLGAAKLQRLATSLACMGHPACRSADRSRAANAERSSRDVETTGFWLICITARRSRARDLRFKRARIHGSKRFEGGTREQKSLHEIDSEGAQIIALGSCLDALREDDNA